MSTDIPIPEILPVLSLRTAVAYPYPSILTSLSLVGTKVEQEMYPRLLEEVKNSGQLLIAVMQKDADKELQSLDDLFRVGTIARLLRADQTPEGTWEFALLGLERATLGVLTQEDSYFMAHVALRTDDLEEDVAGFPDLLDQVLPPFRQLRALSWKIPEESITLQLVDEELQDIVYTMAFMIVIDQEIVQKLLDSDSLLVRLNSLHSYLTTELTKFDQLLSETRGRIVRPEEHHTELDRALAELHSADTWSYTLQLLEKNQKILLDGTASELLRSQIDTLWGNKASKHWIGRLERDLAFLQYAQQHGLTMAHEYCQQRIAIAQHLQEGLDFFKKMTTARTHEELFDLIMSLQPGSVSPAVLTMLKGLAVEMSKHNPDNGEIMHNILSFIEKAQKPDIEEEFENRVRILEMYLDADSFEDAYQLLMDNQEILLSELIIQFLKAKVAEGYEIGEDEQAQMLESHLALFEEARQPGEHSLEKAWQKFVEDAE